VYSNPGDHSELELRFIYSNYSARVETTINGEKIPALRYTYFKGPAISLRYKYELIQPAKDEEANPRGGRIVSLRGTKEFNSFIEGFTVNSEFGTLQEVFTSYDDYKFEADWTEFFALPRRSGLNLMVRGGYIDRPIDSFFNFFAGGLNGIHGYPYYSIEGRKLLHGRATLRTPIFNHMDFKLLHFYFDKLFFGVAYDYGNAFDENKIELKDFKDSISLQTRLEMTSFGSMPTRLFFDAAYGFDKFPNRGIEYGRDWRFYFGLSFDYLDTN
jgi:hypothetical protein